MSNRWEEVKIKYLYNLTNGGTPKSDEPSYWEPKEIEWITPEDLSIPGKKVKDVKRKISKDGLANSSATLINENSVAISTRAPIGNPKLVTFKYSTNQGCKSMSSKKASDNSPDYLYYFLSANEEELKNLGRGTTFLELSNFALRNFRILNPSIEEQNYIVNFLDIKTSEIDTLIEDKEKLIELLEEKRQAIITEAVTKGLDTDVKMKDSGVEWIGEVPVNWDVIQIKWLTSVKRGASPRPIDDPKYFDEFGEFGWVRISDVTKSNKYLINTEQKLSKLGSDKSVKLKKGDLFLSIAGSVGKPCIANISCCIHDGFVYFPEYKESIDYLYYIFETKKPYQGLGKLGTQLNLNTDTVGKIKIPLPPKKTQEKIVENIKKRTNEIDKLLAQNNGSIRLLTEYRQALVYEAVTGKIDVQEMVKETEQEEVSSS